MKVSKSSLIKELLSSREATAKLRDAMRDTKTNAAGKSTFTYNSSGTKRKVLISSVPKAA